jgi:hypothetical protein
MGTVRSQILMEATSTVPRQTKPRLPEYGGDGAVLAELAGGPLDDVRCL